MAENTQVTSELPFVTVIMPICNELAFIERSLAAVLNQDYPPERMEVIVADGMSSDGTREILRSALSNWSNLRVIDNPGRIVPMGLNAAIGVANGQVIVRVDGHTVIASDYVTQCVSELSRTGAEDVGGRMVAIGSGAFGSTVALATGSRFGVGGSRFHYSDEEEWVDSTYVGAWPRRVFEEFGLFDEELVRNQDDEFDYRLRRYGGRILLSPRIRSVYAVRSTPRALASQYFQYGLWKVRVMQKHPLQMRARHFVPPLFVIALFGSLLFAALSPNAMPFFGLITGSYVTVNLAASALTASSTGWRHFFLLPVVFAMIHLSWGLGFLTGLARFWNRWGEARNLPQTLPSMEAIRKP